MMICNINNNERVSLLFILMLCLSGERKQSGIGERKKGDLSPFLMLRRVNFE